MKRKSLVVKDVSDLRVFLVTAMAAKLQDIEPVLFEVDGYVRNMSEKLHPNIIPREINQIIYLFYDPVCIMQISSTYIILHNT